MLGKTIDYFNSVEEWDEDFAKELIGNVFKKPVV